MIAFCLGELVKLGLLAVLFVVAVLFLHVIFGPFFVSFIISLMIYWIAPFIVFGILEKR